MCLEVGKENFTDPGSCTNTQKASALVSKVQEIHSFPRLTTDKATFVYDVGRDGNSKASHLRLTGPT